jgi:hypothetical protein
VKSKLTTHNSLTTSAQLPNLTHSLTLSLTPLTLILPSLCSHVSFFKRLETSHFFFCLFFFKINHTAHCSLLAINCSHSSLIIISQPHSHIPLISHLSHCSHHSPLTALHPQPRTQSLTHSPTHSNGIRRIHHLPAERTKTKDPRVHLLWLAHRSPHECSSVVYGLWTHPLVPP